MADLAGFCRVSSQHVPLVGDRRTIPLRGESVDSVSPAVGFSGLVGGRAFNDYEELLYDYLTIRFDGQNVSG